MTFNVEMTKEKIDFIKKNKKTCNFCDISYFVYLQMLLALSI